MYARVCPVGFARPSLDVKQARACTPAPKRGCHGGAGTVELARYLARLLARGSENRRLIPPLFCAVPVFHKRITFLIGPKVGGRCKPDPSLKAPRFQRLIQKKITVLST